MYKPICQEENLILGSGSTVIVTGWTPKETIAKHLKNDEYAAIGNLYNSSTGVDYLLRNIIANPCIRNIIAISATEYDNVSGSVDTLERVWVHDQCGELDLEVKVMLPILRRHIKYFRFHGVKPAIKTAKSLSTPASTTNQWKALTLKPKATKPSECIPASMHGHYIQAETIANTWIKVVSRVLNHGSIKPSHYGSERQELIDVVAVVTDEPWDCDIPDWLGFSRMQLTQYKDQLLNFQKGVGIKYTYGSRIRSWFDLDQLQEVINKIEQDKYTTQAVVNLWDSAVDIRSCSPPCLNHIRFYVINDELYMTVLFRSHDIYKAWILNAMGLRCIQQSIGTALSLPIAKMTIISQSAHIYSDDWKEARRIVEKMLPDIEKQERQRFDDPVGNFIVRWRSPKIYVEQTNPSGQYVRTYSDKKPMKLFQAIVASNPSMKPVHAAYLGHEITKASLLEEQYIQDK